MITVKNTKELQEKYDLSKIPDAEMVRVTGGLTNKRKYDKEHYILRTTYPARQLKQIINEMEQIEKTIPSKWSDLQKAKYVYEVLGKNISYNYNREEYKNEQSSNLSIILSKKGICAGYSLLFKEMMDRQGIWCDYVRGTAYGSKGEKGTHAWNLLYVEKKVVGLDLTWDARKISEGYRDLTYFGNNSNFEQNHIPDQDEKRYGISSFTQEEIRKIDTNNTVNEVNSTNQAKLIIIGQAIEETYNRFKNEYGADRAKMNAKEAIKKIILKGDYKSITRGSGARQQLMQNISQNEMLEILVEDYVRNAHLEQGSKSEGNNNTLLRHAVKQNIEKYDSIKASYALKRYILENNPNSFTRENGARDTITKYVEPTIALDAIIEDIVTREIDRVISAETVIQKIQEDLGKTEFRENELLQIQLPKDEEKSIISKAIDWIKTRMKENKRNERRK